uniref:Uncharacterized protein n=1 Tax=Strongyloides papillosus TaxID=174720 RepID=A0A0N5BF70_STREA
MTGPCSKLFLSAVREARDDNKRRNHIAASTASLSQSLIITGENVNNFESNSSDNNNSNTQNNKSIKNNFKKNNNKTKPRYHGSMDSLNTDGGGNKTNNPCILPLPLLQMASSNQQNTTTNSPFPTAANFPRTPQILIDPNTGQQYIIPAPQPQIYYQPVYIPAQTAQPNQGQQLFFTPSQNGQIQTQPFILSAQGTSTSGYLYTPRNSNQGSNVSTPVIGQQNEAQQLFTCDGFSRLSNNTTKDNPETPLSSRSNQGNLLTTTFAQMKISQNNRRKGSVEQLSQMTSLDDSKNITRPTLNWNSPKREIKNEYGDDGPRTTPTSPSKFLSKRTPFHSNNYTGNDTKVKSNNDEIKEPTTPTVIQKPIRMDFDFAKIEENKEKKDQAKTPVCRVPPTAFTISFDDDEDGTNDGNVSKKNKPKNLQEARMKKLNSIRNENLSNGGQKINNKKKTNNDNDNSSTTSEDPKRYLLTKLLQGSSGKMSSKLIPNNLISSTGNKSIGSIGKGEDTLSDAGTYVITNDSNKEVSMSKVIDSDDDDSINRSESEYNCDFNEEEEDDYRSPSPINNFKKNNSKYCSNESSSGKSHTSEGTVKSGNMFSYDNENKHKYAMSSTTSSIKCQQQQPLTSNVKNDNQTGGKKIPSTSGTSIKQSSKSGSGRATNTPSVVVKQTVASMARQAMNHSNVENNKDNRSRGVLSSAGTPSTSNNFRRADGGRFSMRGSGTTTVNQKPPFKTGVASARGSSTASPRESSEFAAWLRRKDYNPMKAAAEAKKMKELKSRLIDIKKYKYKIDNNINLNKHLYHDNADSYVSTRSISFHHGAITSKDSNLISDKNNISPRFSISNSKLRNKAPSKDNDIMMTSMDSINENDDDDVGKSKEDIVPSPFTSTQSLHLSKAVDELTHKCQKSIQLIKLFSGQGLSESMENLIEEVISPDSINKDNNEAIVGEDLGHRLENLNTAFDAIQKCLEGFHKEMRHGSPMISRRNNVNSDVNSETTISSQYQDKRSNIGQSRHSLTSLGSSEDSEKITY